MEYRPRTARCQDGWAIFGGLGLAWPDVAPAALDAAEGIFWELVALARERSPEEGRVLAADGSPATAIGLGCELNRTEAEVAEALTILETYGLIESEPWPPEMAAVARGARR